MSSAGLSAAGLSPPGSSAVGIIVNPNAGKDIRRLTSASGQTSDAVKIGIMRRAAAGALEMGAARILFSSDTHHLAERAVEGLAGPGVIEFLDTPLTGSHLDTIAAARTMWKEQVGAVIALGGDGTCRDVATGWPDVPLIAISTGTNNVFPSAVDGTTAGVAAALVATGAVPVEAVSRRAKRVALRIESPTSVVHEHALVEAALIDTAFVGARAVNDPTSIRWVVACIANPASTGLASVAGRVHPVDRNEPGGVLIRLGTGGRRVRVPLAPGTFTTLDVESVEPLEAATTIDLPGGGILAFDGERTTPVSADSTVTVSVESSGPRLLDVDTTLAMAAGDRRFDVTGTPDDGAPDDGTPRRKDTHGD